MKIFDFNISIRFSGDAAQDKGALCALSNGDFINICLVSRLSLEQSDLSDETERRDSLGCQAVFFPATHVR
ncbi:hypothetical protein [Thiobaca trueperi]|uniref:hypothetical protein n=1 Tax=Thiobaca trueperi TaxID=127458 RepID=UPI0010521B7B|nr:hypothetical protein [Thiobaca trueperi]